MFHLSGVIRGCHSQGRGRGCGPQSRGRGRLLQGRGRGSRGSHGRGLVEDGYPPAIADEHVDDVGLDSEERSNMGEPETESEEMQLSASSDNETSSSPSSASAPSTPSDVNVAQSTTTTTSHANANIGASSREVIRGGTGTSGIRTRRGLPPSSRWNLSTIWIANISIVERTDTGAH